jgi:peptidoglycan/LPS O-acetylase OafA/YrhL
MQSNVTKSQTIGASRQHAVSQTIDLVRVLAASAIFYFHVGMFTQYPLMRFGEYAVTSFVVLAGITFVAFSRTHPTDLRSYSKYMATRVLALYPIFLAINLLLFAASYVHPSDLGRPFTISEFAMSCLGVSRYLGYRLLCRGMWFVPFIFQVYAILPVLNWLLSRVYPTVVLIAAFGVSSVLTVTVYWFGPANAASICGSWCPVFRLPEVLLGLFLGRWMTHGARPSRAIGFVIVYVVASGALATLPGQTPFSDLNPSWILALPWNGLIVGSLITVTAVLLLRIPWFTATQLNYRLVGTASFAFYLIHQPAIEAVYGKVGANGVAWLAYYILCWGAALVLTVADGRWRSLAFRKRPTKETELASRS